MKERIRELAEQAFFDDATSQHSDRMYTFSDYKMQQFAELIVRECATIADKWVDDTDNGQNYPSEMIKQYFGVKE